MWCLERKKKKKNRSHLQDEVGIGRDMAAEAPENMRIPGRRRQPFPFPSRVLSCRLPLRPAYQEQGAYFSP